LFRFHTARQTAVHAELAEWSRRCAMCSPVFGVSFPPTNKQWKAPDGPPRFFPNSGPSRFLEKNDGLLCKWDDRRGAFTSANQFGESSGRASTAATGENTSEFFVRCTARCWGCRAERFFGNCGRKHGPGPICYFCGFCPGVGNPTECGCRLKSRCANKLAGRGLGRKPARTSGAQRRRAKTKIFVRSQIRAVPDVSRPRGI